MNCTQFQDPVSHMYLAGTVVASRSLPQEVAGSSHFTVITNIFCHLEKLHCVVLVQPTSVLNFYLLVSEKLYVDLF